jgi:hypothetical protein
MISGPYNLITRSDFLKPITLATLAVGGMLIAVQCPLRAQGPAAMTTSAPAKVISLLRARDQMLLDAIAPGNHAVWEMAMSADFIYIDEKQQHHHESRRLPEAVSSPVPWGECNIAIRTY